MRSHLLERIEDPAVRHPANYAFPGGEGGPHVRVVDEEDIIVPHIKQKNKIHLIEHNSPARGYCIYLIGKFSPRRKFTFH